jgi:hypothetical protein
VIPVTDHRLALSYVVPVRTSEADEELVDHLAELATVVDDVLLVDGSDRDVFQRHAGLLPAAVRHLRPAHDVPMGKVAGVLTGLVHASHDLVVIADDDVRWDRAGLQQAIAGLGDAEVGRPQNRFEPSPWHARWDTGRILINRALSGDWPGTMLVRRAALPRGYAGDALFENLEMVRTIRAAGGTERVLLDVVVVRRPPSAFRFFEQRVRQAYDEWARPWRLIFELTWLPLVLHRPRRAVSLALSAVVLGEVGRRRAGGDRHWGPTAALWTVPWMAERAVTSWLAVAARIRGGVRYRGQRFPVAAHSVHVLRSRTATAERGPWPRPLPTAGHEPIGAWHHQSTAEGRPCSVRSVSSVSRSAAGD